MTEKSLLFGGGRYELQYDPDNPDGVFSLERLDLMQAIKTLTDKQI